MEFPLELDKCFLLLNQAFALAEHFSLNVFVGIETANRRCWSSNGRNLQFDFMSGEMVFKEDDIWLKSGKSVGETVFKRDELFDLNTMMRMEREMPSNVTADSQGLAAVGEDGMGVEVAEELDAMTLEVDNEDEPSPLSPVLEAPSVKMETPQCLNSTGVDAMMILESVGIGLPLEENQIIDVETDAKRIKPGPPQEIRDEPKSTRLNTRRTRKASMAAKTLKPPKQPSRNKRVERVPTDEPAKFSKVPKPLKNEIIDLDRIREVPISEPDGEAVPLAQNNESSTKIDGGDSDLQNSGSVEAEVETEDVQVLDDSPADELPHTSGLVPAKGPLSGRCRICNQRFASRDLRVEHYRKEHCTCKECGYTALKAHSVRLHIAVVHEKKKLFCCSKCGMAFSNHSTKYAHERRNCIEFRQPKSSDDGVEPVLKVRKPSPCYICDQPFDTKKERTAHLRSVHFRCDLCQRSFHDKQTLQRHILSVHQKLKPFKCEKCGKGFSQKSTVKTHDLAVHQDVSDVICAICGKAFRDAGHLNAHIQRHHDGTRSHACSLCPSKFFNASRLKHHVESTHLGLKPHACKLCGKRFGLPGGVTQHMKFVHSQGKRHTCEVCGKKFVTVGKLNRHRKTHGNKKLDTEGGLAPFSCPIDQLLNG